MDPRPHHYSQMDFDNKEYQGHDWNQTDNANTTCQGCRKLFSSKRGLAQHLAQVKDPRSASRQFWFALVQGGDAPNFQAIPPPTQVHPCSCTENAEDIVMGNTDQTEDLATAPLLPESTNELVPMQENRPLAVADMDQDDGPDVIPEVHMFSPTSESNRPSQLICLVRAETFRLQISLIWTWWRMMQIFKTVNGPMS